MLLLTHDILVYQLHDIYLTKRFLFQSKYIQSKFHQFETKAKPTFMQQENNKTLSVFSK